MDFPKRRDTATTTGDGKGFLAQAKAQLHEVFSAVLQKSDDFPTLDEYTDALEKEAWSVTEAIAKASWKNGIARGQGRQKGVKA